MWTSQTLKLAEDVGHLLQERSGMLCSAESCTGGLVAAAVTAIAGSSGWFDRGFVTYTNTAKMAHLGVLGATLDAYGAVSEETAREMALGALGASSATIAVSVTGIAGPGGATPGKPVGMVCFGWARRTPDGPAAHTTTLMFSGDRAEVRAAAVDTALRGILEFGH